MLFIYTHAVYFILTCTLMTPGVRLSFKQPQVCVQCKFKWSECLQWIFLYPKLNLYIKKTFQELFLNCKITGNQIFTTIPHYHRCSPTSRSSVCSLIHLCVCKLPKREERMRRSWLHCKCYWFRAYLRRAGGFYGSHDLDCAASLPSVVMEQSGRVQWSRF